MRSQKENPIKRLFEEQLKSNLLNGKGLTGHRRDAAESNFQDRNQADSCREEERKHKDDDGDCWDPTGNLNEAKNTDAFNIINHLTWRTPEGAADFDEDDGLYNPDADDSDAEYVNRKYRVGDKSTDAVLCCPGCFTPLCYQCQRHELYINQYRAISAVNCKIHKNRIPKRLVSSSKFHRQKDEKEKEANTNRQVGGEMQKEREREADKKDENEQKNLTVNGTKETAMDTQGLRKKVEHQEELKEGEQTHETDRMEEEKEKYRGKESGGVGGGREQRKSDGDDEDMCYLVTCIECNNEVAYLDSNQLFHFFDVLPGEP